MALHNVLRDFISKVGPSPVIEEEQAVIYLHQKRYKEALSIYERILPKWDPPSGQLDVMPSVACHRAAICAAYLGDWKKASVFFEDGVKRTQNIENIERHVSFYVDAGFAQFKAGNMLDSIKLLNLALQKFEMLPEDNTNLTYFTLKKRLACSIGWIAYHEDENYTAKSQEPPVGFCSNPETNEEVLNLPDSRIEYIWLALARIECKFAHGTTVLEHVLQITKQNTDPRFSSVLCLLETQYDFKNKTFDGLPQRIYQLANVYGLIQKHNKSKKEINSIPIADSPDFASVENITFIFVTGLLVQLSTGKNIHETLSIWRANSSGLPIKENVFIALDLIESMLSGNQSNALAVMRTQESKGQKRLVAALKIVQNKETSLENLFLAHTFIATSLISTPWEDFVLIGLAELLSEQWLEKINSGAMWQINVNIVQQIEHACKSSETSKKKIGQILLAAYPVVSTMIPSGTLQQFRTWTESPSKQKQEPATRKNPAAQRLIKAMEKPPHITDEDIETLNQSIKEGKIPIKFDSPFEPDEPENNE